MKNKKSKMRTVWWISLACLAALLLGFGIRAWAVVPTTSDLVSYPCNGTSTAFVFGFGVFATSEVRVVLVDANDAESPLTENSHYTVSLPNADGFLVPGGTVTTAVAYPSGNRIVLSRRPPMTQESGYATATSLDLETMEDDFDKAVLRDQHLQRQITRALRAPETDATDFNLPVASLRANSMIAFDANGAPYVLAGVIGPNDVTVTDFWAAILDDANGVESRAALDVQQRFACDVRAFGAFGDGVTDDTEAMQAAFDAAGSGTLLIPSGTFLCNVTLDSERTIPNIIGAGSKISILKSAVVGEPVIHITGTGFQGYPARWRSFQVHGGTEEAYDSNGIDVDGDAAWLNLHLQDVSIYYCDNGFTTRGLLKYSMHECAVRFNNIGVLIDNFPTNHGGCAEFINCNVEGNQQAGFALVGGGQFTFYGGEYEENFGPAIYMKEAGSWAHPTVIDQVWFEKNGKGDSVTIEGDTFDPADMALWLEDAYTVRLNNLTTSMIKQIGRTVLYQDGGRLSSPLQSIDDANGIYEARNLLFDNNITEHSWVHDIYAPGAHLVIDDDANDLRMGAYTHPSPEVAYDYTNLIPYGSCATEFTPPDANGKSVTFVTTGAAPIYGTCLYLDDLPAGGDSLDGVIDLWPGDISITEDKWYVFTVDVKSYGEDGYLSLRDKFGASDLLVGLNAHTTDPATYGYGMRATTDRWRRYVQMRQADDTAIITQWRVYNAGTTDPNFYLANAQLVEFDSPQAAHEFIRRNAYSPPRATVPALHLDDVALTGNYTVVPATDNGMVFTNDGAVDGDSEPNEITIKLGAATVGQRYTFWREDPNGMVIDPIGVEYFRGHGAGKYLRLDDDGCSVEIQCLKAGHWTITAAYDPNMAGENAFKWEP
ncbi:MAG TPA: glycosyl hydrolase family 28-related protein [Phycisphaerae bacterium]|nr:glycosyl hydrolase family 28-related protein [Phycisphaerae bacterium]